MNTRAALIDHHFVLVQWMKNSRKHMKDRSFPWIFIHPIHSLCSRSTLLLCSHFFARIARTDQMSFPANNTLAWNTKSNCKGVGTETCRINLSSARKKESLIPCRIWSRSIHKTFSVSWNSNHWSSLCFQHRLAPKDCHFSPNSPAICYFIQIQQNYRQPIGKVYGWMPNYMWAESSSVVRGDYRRAIMCSSTVVLYRKNGKKAIEDAR